MGYNILHHNELDIKSIEKTFGKTLQQLQKGDFKSADVRKMGTTGFYRARLDIRDRLLFSLVKYQGQTFLLLLEIIKEHNYAQSRFLRGASLPEESQLAPIVHLEKDTIDPTFVELSYLHPNNQSLHLLNKFISFDDLQSQVMALHPPLIIIGSAGSGKTAVVLEKLKSLPGNVAYMSLSKFLVENAANLYYAAGYENEHQEVEFLSLSDYLASWQKPTGKEIHFRAFAPWFARHAQALRINEPYRVFEEFKGVITGSPIHTAYLSEEEYLTLGVKQSIFGVEERQRLYPLFLKYLEWLQENNWYDSNIICFDYLKKVQPRYDYIIIDEVQDITNIQLKCLLQSLIKPNHFLLTGDSNQIVHPNFFSWSKVKSYFHNSGSASEQIKILQTNYRNSQQVVTLSNSLLKIKNARFGSIDKESNYLVNTISSSLGEAILYTDDDKKKTELNRRTQNSTQYAVIVTDSIFKAEASKYFKTPLVFSVQEAKGLEYENVILVNFISNHDTEFKEIINGVTEDDLKQNELIYNRSANKQDKDAEIYKFYINSFYVAITRAIKNIYLFEKKVTHPTLQLLQLIETKKEIQVAEAKSTKEEWLFEAQRLEEQGKYEQAEQIRAKYLGYEYLSQEQLEQICLLALNPTKKENEVKKERKQLFEYATNHQRFDWVEQLANLKFQRAMLYMREVRQYRKEFAKNMRLGQKQAIQATLQKYGSHFATDEGANALMLALHYGQTTIATELIATNNLIKATDKKSWLAIDYLVEGFFKTVYGKQPQMATLQTVKQFWHLVKPSHLSINNKNRVIQVSSHSMLFFLIVAMRTKEATQKTRISVSYKDNSKLEEDRGGFNIDDILSITALFPDEILPPYRKKRPYINSFLSANEEGHKDKRTCKPVFARVTRGTYILSPGIIWGDNQ